MCKGSAGMVMCAGGRFADDVNCTNHITCSMQGECVCAKKNDSNSMEGEVERDLQVPNGHGWGKGGSPEAGCPWCVSHPKIGVGYVMLTRNVKTNNVGPLEKAV